MRSRRLHYWFQSQNPQDHPADNRSPAKMLCKLLDRAFPRHDPGATDRVDSAAHHGELTAPHFWASSVGGYLRTLPKPAQVQGLCPASCAFPPVNANPYRLLTYRLLLCSP